VWKFVKYLHQKNSTNETFLPQLNPNLDLLYSNSDKFTDETTTPNFESYLNETPDDVTEAFLLVSNSTTLDGGFQSMPVFLHVLSVTIHVLIVIQTFLGMLLPDLIPIFFCIGCSSW